MDLPDSTISERAKRWGIVPAYHSWQGELVRTSPETEAAILRAMDANDDDPPPIPSPGLPDEQCAPAPERAWGWAVQLYALRSRESWGVGDLGDLRRFARWSRQQGASLILLNPLGAQSPALPYEASPYFASTRRFRNTIYIRVEDVDGAQNVDLDELSAAARALNTQRVIDYDEVFKLKSRALELVFQTAPEPTGLRTYLRAQGRALREFARFNAMSEVHGPGWRGWPQNAPEPDPRRVAFHQWLQFHVDRQLARVSREIGLIPDVPVGFAPDGFDAWRWREYLAPGIRVGVPPDEFFRDGQDWGLPAFNPWKLGDAHWEPFIDAIRSAPRHAAGVRLDHVMGLFRIFWIPEEMNAAHGAFVRQPAEVLLSLLAHESRRAGAFIVGEDLGLVEPEVRRHLEERRSLSYRLVWFEGSDPAQWPRDAVAAVGTHDLPTIAGMWTLSEPEQRLHHLREKLVNLTHLPDETSPVDVAVEVYRHLAAGSPRIVLASLEDALGVHERPNVPGTTTERPNWRLALPVPIEEIETSDGVLRVAQVMRDAGRL